MLAARQQPDWIRRGIGELPDEWHHPLLIDLLSMDTVVQLVEQEREPEARMLLRTRIQSPRVKPLSIVAALCAGVELGREMDHAAYVRMFELPDDLSGEALPGEMIPNAESILQMVDAVGPGQRLVVGLLSALGCREHRARFTDESGKDRRLEILLKASGADGVVGLLNTADEFPADYLDTHILVEARGRVRA